MKRLITGALTLFSAAVILTPSASAEDITKHWAYPAMSDLISKQVMKGDPTGNYYPNADVTRAEFATFLVRALQLPEVTAAATFKDVVANSWYYDAINRASNYQLIKGDENGNFNPNNKIDRQQMAVMIKRALDYKGVAMTPSSLAFKDTSQIADWAYADIQNIISLNIIVGKPDYTFSPLANATRAEAATVIYRISNPNQVPEKVVVAGTEYLTTSYPSDFTNVSVIQANNSPKVDGAGIFTASQPLVAYYANPNNFKQGSPEYFQFLKLSTPITNLNATLVDDKVLADKGILAGNADAFIEAGFKFSMNAIYLISHALHETGNGASALANGIEVGVDVAGKPTMVTADNRATLTNIKKAYNMYGVRAVDATPNKSGSEYAYSQGWFTPKDAIIGGAQFVKDRYIGVGQDTLYKMRWNPDNPTVHQYATHVMWATIQAGKIYDLYTLTGANTTTKMAFELPRYQAQPVSSPLPNIENRYALNPVLEGTLAKANVNLNFRTYPNTNDPLSIISQLPLNTQFTILGDNGGWYKISVNGQIGWVIDDYVSFVDKLQINDVKASIDIRTLPDPTSPVVQTITGIKYVSAILNTDKSFLKQGDWYKITINGQSGWIHSKYIIAPQ